MNLTHPEQVRLRSVIGRIGSPDGHQIYAGVRRRSVLRIGAPVKGADAQMRSIAERLLLSDAAAFPSQDVCVDDAFPAMAKLHPQLAILMGTGGVRMLVRRALMLATSEVPWLNGHYMNSTGGVEGLSELGIRMTPAEYLEGRVTMLAHLLGLLVVLIGPSLTSNLLSDIWPQLPLEALDFALE